MKMLIVGSGVTSSLTGMCLRKMFPDCNLNIWDKARGTGGRMTTSRCTLNASCTADIGAQYITTTEDFVKANGDIYDELLTEGVLEPLECKIINMKPQGNNTNFVIPNGSGALVKKCIQKANVNQLKFSHHVSSINKYTDRPMWLVKTTSGEKEDFDVVILTIPVPQLFLLEGNIKDELTATSNLMKKLKCVNYSARFVLVLYFLENINEDWGAQYLDNDPVFRYVAIDNVKRNRPEQTCAVVFHTTVGFGLKHIEESIANMESVLLAQAKSLFPTWPEPKAVKCHKWRYSQVTNIFPDSPGYAVISTTPPLLIGGDGFVGSTFDNCVKSSKAMCVKLKQMLQTSSNC